MRVLIFVFFILSVVLLTIGLFFSIWYLYKKYYSDKKMAIGKCNSRYSFSKTITLLTAFVIPSIFFLRYAVAFYGINFGFSRDYETLGQLEWSEEIVNSLLHTLQTFSMDEEYTMYWCAGKEMMTGLFENFGAGNIITDIFVFWFSLHTALLNIIAPVIDGAIIVGILSKIFPKIKLFFAKIFFRREMYYFSELNANALAIAKSILSDPARKRSIIVFTDAYSDDEEEKSSEYLLEAKSIGAICIKDDITHINIKSRTKHNTYIMLIDMEENNNIETLTKLLSRQSLSMGQVTELINENNKTLTIHKLKSALNQDMSDNNIRIYVFSTDRRYSFIEDEIERIMNIEKEKGKLFSGSVLFSMEDIENRVKKCFDNEFFKDNDLYLKEAFRIMMSADSQEEYDKKKELLEEEIEKLSPPLHWIYKNMKLPTYKSFKKQVKRRGKVYFGKEDGFQSIRNVLSQIKCADDLFSIQEIQSAVDILAKEAEKANDTDNKMQLSYLLLKKCLQNFKEQLDSLIPIVIPVNGIKNMACTLLQKVPLFEPLIIRKRHNDSQKDLNVTILGAGSLATEFFLSVYSFGQMIGHHLNINVVSKNEDQSVFEDRLNYINPEILRSGKKHDEILVVDSSGKNKKYNDPYMTYKFYPIDVYSEEFDDLLKDKEGSLSDTDYFIVALGSDEDNCEIADHIRQVFARNIIRREEKNRSTVIAYVVYNSALCRHRNQSSQKFYSSDRREADIYMYAFGCLDEVYSVMNVFFNGVIKDAERINNIFIGNWYNENSAHEKYGNLLKDYYNYKSSSLRAMHLVYKYYSAWNCLTDLSSIDPNVSADFDMESVFDRETDKYIKTHEEVKAAYERLYNDKNYPSSDHDIKVSVLSKLAWLEHRRWCAFMRTCRFRCCDLTLLERFFELDCSDHKRFDHKYLSLKLHPCLVECTDKGIIADLNEYGNVIESSELQKPKKDYLSDKLDEVSYRVYELKKANNQYYYDFKRWDYPNNS